MMSGTEHDSSVGSDSFLDVITNFVGILIILVMVVGQNAKTAGEALARAPIDAELAAAASEAEKAEQDAHCAEAQTAQVQAELAANRRAQSIEHAGRSDRTRAGQAPCGARRKVARSLRRSPRTGDGQRRVGSKLDAEQKQIESVAPQDDQDRELSHAAGQNG